MYFKQFFDKKLAQTSYMVACQQTNEAIIIDPMRVLDVYQNVAEEEGFTITHATETHIHADFASGLRDAKERFGARLFVSDEGDKNWKYKNVPEDTVFLKNGDKIKIGHVELKVVHTPGHTPESISFVLTDFGGGSTEPMGMFTGDFIFVGDIGRPDLLEEAANMAGTTDVGANAMYESIQKMKTYPDFLQIWPGHGAGSACGKSLGAVPQSTLGYERKNNWAFQMDDRAEFISELTKDQPEPPVYFAQMKQVNKIGLPHFKVKNVEIATPEKLTGQVFDLRTKEEFSQGFSKGSINIPYNSKFLQFFGWFIDYEKPMTAIIDPKHSKALQEDLASIGYDDLVLIVPAEKVDKYVNDTYKSVTPEEFIKLYQNKNILDVRSTAEYQAGNLAEATHLHYGYLAKKEVPFNKDEQIYIHCQSGVRSAIAMSVLKARGYNHLVNVASGYLGIMRAKA